jgi:FADH2 O2-dependent halogenase
MTNHFDVAIIGSGFSGSILALILARRGRRVVLLDAAAHPRFAIGESSTPIADILLRRLGEQYDLPDLTHLSSYGRWQQAFPTLACGKKRGFSYFDHREPQQPDRETTLGDRSLIVAASPTDRASDTHWFRSDVDSFLFERAVAAGVEGRQASAVAKLEVNGSDPPRLRLEDGSSLSATFLIDASGAACVSARTLGRPDRTTQLQTRTCSSFAHFRNVGSFSERFSANHGDRRALDPFDADDAAQHHLIDEGWAWMLRMNNGITSIGVTSPLGSDRTRNSISLRATHRVLSERFREYAGLSSIMTDAVLVGPQTGIVSISRVQRLFDPSVSRNCLMMPTTAVAIDPLHSTGIAHALAGVQRVACLILRSWDDESLQRYRDGILAEAVHLDRLVAMAYRAIGSFPRFTIACMVYFAAAIASEERIGRGEMPERLWQADDLQFVAAIEQCDRVMRSDLDNQSLASRIRKLISPWNTAGLLDDRVSNRYAYTATKQ